MPTEAKRRRGQPIMFLGVLFFGWTLLRILFWESPLPVSAQAVVEMPPPGEVLSPLRIEAWLGASSSHRLPDVRSKRARAPNELSGFLLTGKLPPLPLAEIGAPDAASSQSTPAGAEGFQRPSDLWAPSLPATNSDPQKIGFRRHVDVNPWRVDAWLLLRPNGGSSITAGDRPASYGASQAGAVISYRLGPGTGLDPAAYFRASRALVSNGESEGALGLRVRPFEQLPFFAHGEVRIVDSGEGTELRPAAFVSSSLSDVPFGFGWQGEGYVQAGYVAGDFATGFVDGRVTAVRPVLRGAAASLGVGAGLWGGAQRGSERLDLGPSAQLALNLGQVPVRVAADYRIRVAGDARPDSGVAITLSTGF